MSQNNALFLKKCAESIHQKEDKHYEMKLPFKQEDPILPDNKSIAEKSLYSLRRKLLKDEKLHQQYVAFMKKLLDKGYAEIVQDEHAGQKGHRWYTTHHGVFHHFKPDNKYKQQKGLVSEGFEM